MKIRSVNKSDEADVLNLLDEFRADCMEQISGNIGFSDTAIIGGKKIFDELLENENYHISLLIEDDNIIVGIITGYLCPMLRSGELRAEVEEFFVKKVHRGKGGAQLLMDSFFNWCKSRNVSKVNLESDNQLLRAHAFYKNYGFESKAQRFVKKMNS